MMKIFALVGIAKATSLEPDMPRITIFARNFEDGMRTAPTVTDLNLLYARQMEEVDKLCEPLPSDCDQTRESILSVYQNRHEALVRIEGLQRDVDDYFDQPEVEWLRLEREQIITRAEEILGASHLILTDSERENVEKHIESVTAASF
jgi:hypothetical protein